MNRNPFLITKAEGFNHSYGELAALMEFKPGTADVLLGNTNVFIEGSRGSGKSMYLRLLSTPVKSRYEKLASVGAVNTLPSHNPYLGVYIKLVPTVFGPHEYEDRPGFKGVFQQLFNTYCAEQIVDTIAEAKLLMSVAEENSLCRYLSQLLLKATSPYEDINALSHALHQERLNLSHRLNMLPFSSDARSEPDLLWEIGRPVTHLQQFSGTRIHLLVDEYDTLTENQQKIINMYVRSREAPLTFKIGCKKHRLALVDINGNPLNPSGDFDPVELDDNDFGLSNTSYSYLEAIANRRLKNAGLGYDIRTFLGSTGPRRRQRAERQYAGFKTVALLSSGIVRTFLELCRDMYAKSGSDVVAPITVNVQDEVIKTQATKRWNVLARDHSAKPELQTLVQRLAQLFAERSKGSENQIIRVEILDFGELPSFARGVLDQALDYEALIQPNRERQPKNSNQPSRGYVLNRLLCVHFRLEPTSRWDVEITSEQLVNLVMAGEGAITEIIRKPGRRSRPVRVAKPASLSLFAQSLCPVLNAQCPAVQPTPGLGFLACRLPIAGPINDATAHIKNAFAESAPTRGVHYTIKTATDYPPMGDIACKVCHGLAKSDFVLVELSRFSPSVAFEFGMAQARNLPVFLLFNTHEQPEVPEPWGSLEYFAYAITPADVTKLVTDKIIPALLDDKGGRGRMRLGPVQPPADAGEGFFVSLPDYQYYQETVLPKLKDYLESLKLGPVRTEHEGLALQDLQRTMTNIAASRYCFIDTTQGAPTRAFALGVALGYRRPFANLIDRSKDPHGSVFTDAKSKAEIEYQDTQDLIGKIGEFLEAQGAIS